jgi:hypothetical protein
VGGRELVGVGEPGGLLFGVEHLEQAITFVIGDRHGGYLLHLPVFITDADANIDSLSGVEQKAAVDGHGG